MIEVIKQCAPPTCAVGSRCMRRSVVHSSLCILLAPWFNLATMRFAAVASSREASNARKALSRFVGGVDSCTQ